MRLVIGQRVKVIDQDIIGEVVDVYGSKVVIEEIESDFEWPDNRLEFRASDLQEIE